MTERAGERDTTRDRRDRRDRRHARDTRGTRGTREGETQGDGGQTRGGGLRAVRDFALALAAGVVPATHEGEPAVEVRRPLFSVLPLGETVRRMTERRRQALMEYHAQLATRNRRNALRDERAVQAFERLVERGYGRAAEVLTERGVPHEAVVETQAGGTELVTVFQERTYPQFRRAQWREEVEAVWTAMAVANVCMLAGVPEDGKELRDAVRDVERASLFFGMAKGDERHTRHTGHTGETRGTGDAGDTGEARDAGETQETQETPDAEVRMPEDVERTGYARYRTGRERIFEQEVDGRQGTEAAFALAELLARCGREWT